MSLATLFDYDTLDIETRIVVQQKTGEIKERVRRSRQDILEIGERLIEIKDRLGHGGFGRWLEVEFGWSDRTAQGFMCVAESFKSEIISDLDITPTALQSLAAPSVPEPARQEAIESARNGNHIGVRDAKEIIAKHKAERADARTAGPVVDLFAADDARKQAEIESPEPDPDDEPVSIPTPGNHCPLPGQAVLFTGEEAPEPDQAAAERRRRQFMKCLDGVDDLTRAVAARVCHGGYDGLPVVLSGLERQEILRLKGKIETLVERLKGWVVQIKESQK